MVTDRPLTPTMRRVLGVLAGGEPMTPNAIGYRLHLPPVRRRRGPWSGIMGPAQRIIPSIAALERRDLVHYTSRPDGLSGSAYRITAAGLEALRS